MMALNEHHPTLTLAADMQAAAKPLFDKYNLNYFQYLTVYNDGSFSLGCNRANWSELAFRYFEKDNKPAVYSHINADQLNKNTYFFLWEPNLPEEPVKLAKDFDIANGLCFVERHADYYNLIAFASPVSNHRAVDTYLNNLNELMQFIKTFQHDQKGLITQFEQAKIILPKERHDENLGKMLYQPKHKAIPVSFQGLRHYVTPQEYACLKALASGGTYKAIGRLLNISPRTVESYLSRVKDRFDLQHKSQLIVLANSL